MNKKTWNIVWVLLGILFLLLLGIYFWRSNRQNKQMNNQPVVEESADRNSEPEGLAEILTNLSIPWDIGFLPTGEMIFTQRNGHAFMLQNGAKIDLGLVEGTSEVGEGGLLGVAIDPEYPQNNFLYFYSTYRQGQDVRNRVTRWKLENNRITNREIIIENIPGSTNHNGGALESGPDGKLYIGTGDATQTGLSQDTNSLAGKILRINKDGTVPNDNPFNNPVWAYGLRNPQGIAFHPVTNTLFATEHGPTRMDEINIIERGKNYGWPNYQCNQRIGVELQNHTEPIACYDDFTLAPSGLDFSNPNDLYVAGLRGEQLRKITLANNYRAVSSQSIVLQNIGRQRAVKKYQDSLYVSTSNTDERGTARAGDDKIIRINVSDE